MLLMPRCWHWHWFCYCQHCHFCRCFFRYRFHLIVFCAPHHCCCCRCLCRRHCHCCCCQCYCCCCHHCHHYPVAVIAVAFMLRCPLILVSGRLAIACFFSSVVGIFTTCPSFWSIVMYCQSGMAEDDNVYRQSGMAEQCSTTMMGNAVAVQQMTTPHIVVAVWQKMSWLLHCLPLHGPLVL